MADAKLDPAYFNRLGILRVGEQSAPAPDWDKLSFVEKRLLTWQREAQQGKAR